MRVEWLILVVQLCCLLGQLVALRKGNRDLANLFLGGNFGMLVAYWLTVLSK